jgi:CheY-like chemotaxis protein
MPGVDGLEVLRQVKQLAPDLPVVMITSHAGTQDIAAALQSGVYAYVVKPFEHDDVVRLLRDLVPAGLRAGASPESGCGGVQRLSTRDT